MKVSRSHIIDREGIDAVTTAFQNLHWLVREQPTSDLGVDAHVEKMEPGDNATGRMLALQIKSGTSYFKETDKSGVIYRGDSEHLEYWLSHALPVILVLRDPASGQIIWEHVSESTVKRTPKGWKIHVPFAQSVDGKSARKLDALSFGSPYELRLKRLQEGRPWIQAIESGKQVRIEIEQWINKSSGRGSITLVTAEPDGNPDDEIATKWDVMFPGWSYPAALAELLPWAALEIDEDFYADHDRDVFEMDYGIRGPDGRVHCFEDFDEWKQRTFGTDRSLRPYAEEMGGEVARWRLLVSLNKLGKAFVRVDAYLRDEDSADGS